MAVNEKLKERLLKEMEVALRRDERFLGENQQSGTRQSHVAQEAVHLNSEIDKLHEVIGLLEDRLSPVLRPIEPQEEDGRKAESLVAHADWIRDKAWEVFRAHERLRDILQRLEL